MQLVVDRIRCEYSKGDSKQLQQQEKQQKQSTQLSLSSSSLALTHPLLFHGFQNNKDVVIPDSKPNQILAFSDGHRRFGTSVRHDEKFRKLKSATEAGRVLLSDRKGWTEHLTAPNLVKSVSFILLFIYSGEKWCTEVAARLVLVLVLAAISCHLFAYHSIIVTSPS